MKFDVKRPEQPTVLVIEATRDEFEALASAMREVRIRASSGGKAAFSTCGAGTAYENLVAAVESAT